MRATTTWRLSSFRIGPSWAAATRTLRMVVPLPDHPGRSEAESRDPFLAAWCGAVDPGSRLRRVRDDRVFYESSSLRRRAGEREVELAQAAGQGAGLAVADRPAVDRDDRHDEARGAGPGGRRALWPLRNGERPLLDPQAVLLGEPQHRLPRDA